MELGVHSRTPSLVEQLSCPCQGTSMSGHKSAAQACSGCWVFEPRVQKTNRVGVHRRHLCRLINLVSLCFVINSHLIEHELL